MKLRNLVICSLSLALAQAIIGINIVIGKYLTEFMSMYTFIFGRFLICAVVLGYFYWRRSFTIVDPAHPRGKLTSRDWVYLLAQGLSAGLIFNVIFYHGLQYTTATSAGIVACSLPAVLAVLAVIFLRESLTWIKAGAILLTIVGILIINIDNALLNEPNHGSFYGDIFIFLAMVPEAFFSIFSKKVISRVSEMGTAFVSGIVTAGGSIPFFFYDMHPPHELSGVLSWPWLAFPLLLLSGMLTILFYPLWGRGLQHIPVSTAAIFGGVVSIATSVLGFFFLGEQFGIWDGIGMGIVFFALFLGTLRSPREFAH